MNEIASRACSGRSTRGTMIPCAPRSSARPIRSRSPDCGRTRAAAGVAPIAWRLASRSDFGAGAVFEVEEQPIEAGAGHDLDRHGRCRAPAKAP